MATYSIGDLSRREILRMSAVLGIASAASTRFAIAQTAGQRTPEQILGPFYPLKTLDQNADLTVVAGRPGARSGPRPQCWRASSQSEGRARSRREN